MLQIVLRLRAVVSCCLVMFTAGCRIPPWGPVPPPPVPIPSPETITIAPTIDYVEDDSFDTTLEAYFRKKTPILVIQTLSTKPNWNGRLNAWLAAWNAGADAHPKPSPEESRMKLAQRGLIDFPPDAAEQTRILIEDQIIRIEEAAKQGVRWWRDEQKRKDRTDLLKPYVLEFHRDANQRYQLVFYR